MVIYNKIKKNIKEKTFWPKIHDKCFFLIQPVFSCVFRQLPIDDSKITFDSFEGTGFGGDPKFICEELLQRKLNLKIIWFVRKYHDNFPDGVTQVKINSIRAIYHQSTAKVWVDNTRTGHRTKKRPSQKYMQTWHGNLLGKKCEKDAEDKLWPGYIPVAQYDGMITNAFIVANRQSLDLAKRSFWLNDKVEYLKIGAPSIDLLLCAKNDDSIKKKVKQKFGISEETYIILYAPSFRDDGSLDGYKLDFQKLIHAFEHNTRRKCVMLIRFHPDVVQHEKSFAFTDNLINATRYEDLKELSLTADCLITDYSSVAYDFLILRKPIFRICLDFEKYKQLRDVYDEFYQLPYGICLSNEQAIETVNHFSNKEYQIKLDEYFKINTIYDNGTASKHAADWICSQLGIDGEF